MYKIKKKSFSPSTLYFNIKELTMKLNSSVEYKISKLKSKKRNIINLYNSDLLDINTMCLKCESIDKDINKLHIDYIGY